MKKLLTLLLLGLCSVPAAAQDVSIPHTIFEFPNGLKLIVHEDHSTPIAEVNVWYHVGSGYEEPGRTGFAHLFEHIMFEGSANVPRGEFDRLLEAAGGRNNGTTNVDRTNYFETVPSNAVELALWLEADRMGGLLETMSQQKLDIQRDVVKNERRQSYENRPYGGFWETQAEALYPARHPYSWTTIGSMEDLSAASLEDVESFFRRYYVPNNAVISVAGAVDAEEVRDMVERYFGWIPRGEAVERPRAGDPGHRGEPAHHAGGPRHASAVQRDLAHAGGLFRGRRGPRCARADPRGRQELPALRSPRLRGADRAGRERVQLVQASLGRLHRADHGAGGHRARPDRGGRGRGDRPPRHRAAPRRSSSGCGTRRRRTSCARSSASPARPTGSTSISTTRVTPGTRSRTSSGSAR
jgi:hypothetical protein